MRVILSVAIALWMAPGAGFAADDVEAYEPAPRDRLWYSNATYVRGNPLGLVDSFSLGWRRRLSQQDGVLFRDTYAFVGSVATVTPAWTRLGISADAQVLAVLRVFGEVGVAGYYGVLDQVLTFDDPGVRYSDKTIDALGDAAQSAIGWRANLGATVRMKVGPIAVRSTLQFFRIDMLLDRPGLYFYDALPDRLVRDGGWTGTNDLDLMYVGDSLRLGARYSWSDAFDDRDNTVDSALAHHRVGPLFAWQFADKAPGAAVNEPTLFVLAQWWLQHPYRTGEEQHAAVPLVAVGFAFNGDLRVSAE